MEIFKHIKYNPFMRDIVSVIEEAQIESSEWKFEHTQPVTQYDWIAIFSRWVQEDPKALTSSPHK